MSAYREADTKQAGGKRRQWPEALKRQFVAETLEPGASVSVVARRHDINANQLFTWRRALARSTPTARLVPVAVMSEPAAGPVLEPAPGRIEIVLSGGVRVRIEGAADPAVVTAAMAAVMKARRRR